MANGKRQISNGFPSGIWNFVTPYLESDRRSLKALNPQSRILVYLLLFEFPASSPIISNSWVWGRKPESRTLNAGTDARCQIKLMTHRRDEANEYCCGFRSVLRVRIPKVIRSTS
ncbi:hypothetical protein SBA2_450005 [Acidobacteriia bacterium SbA2]|nr:hypothetical protein SBA2_450005 [Acidobacteriia bacterium SbA2]